MGTSRVTFHIGAEILDRARLGETLPFAFGAVRLDGRVVLLRWCEDGMVDVELEFGVDTLPTFADAVADHFSIADGQ